jgi:hypothetical protein
MHKEAKIEEYKEDQMNKEEKEEKQTLTQQTLLLLKPTKGLLVHVVTKVQEAMH